MAKPKTVVGRVLTATDVDGVRFECDALVEVTADQAKGMVELGVLDPNPDAVTYCQSIGVEIVSTVAPDAEA